MILPSFIGLACLDQILRGERVENTSPDSHVLKKPSPYRVKMQGFLPKLKRFRWFMPKLTWQNRRKSLTSSLDTFFNFSHNAWNFYSRWTTVITTSPMAHFMVNIRSEMSFTAYLYVRISNI